MYLSQHIHSILKCLLIINLSSKYLLVLFSSSSSKCLLNSKCLLISTFNSKYLLVSFNNLSSKVILKYLLVSHYLQVIFSSKIILKCPLVSLNLLVVTFNSMLVTHYLLVTFNSSSFSSRIIHNYSKCPLVSLYLLVTVNNNLCSKIILNRSKYLLAGLYLLLVTSNNNQIILNCSNCPLISFYLLVTFNNNLCSKYPLIKFLSVTFSNSRHSNSECLPVTFSSSSNIHYKRVRWQDQVPLLQDSESCRTLCHLCNKRKVSVITFVLDLYHPFLFKSVGMRSAPPSEVDSPNSPSYESSFPPLAVRKPYSSSPSSEKASSSETKKQLGFGKINCVVCGGFDHSTYNCRKREKFFTHM